MLRKSIEEGYGHVLSFSGNTQIAITPLSILSRKYTFLFSVPLILSSKPSFSTISSLFFSKPNTSLPILKENCDHAREVGETGDRSSNSQRVCRRRTICSRFTTLTIVLSRSQNQNFKFFPIYWFSRECSRFTTVTLNCTICSACYWTLHACCSPWPPIPRRDFDIFSKAGKPRPARMYLCSLFFVTLLYPAETVECRVSWFSKWIELTPFCFLF